MTIACTRCGATEDGNIISAPIAFAFKHEVGCAHGIGPLAVLPSGFKKKSKVAKDPVVTNKTFTEQINEQIIDELEKDSKEDIKVEEKPKKSVKEKIKIFGKREKSDA